MLATGVERAQELTSILTPVDNKLVLECSLFAIGWCAMDNRKRMLVNIPCIAAISIIGATLMMGLDVGGTRWLKFILYLIFFASISSSAFFSSPLSCAAMFSRLRKRS